MCGLRSGNSRIDMFTLIENRFRLFCFGSLIDRCPVGMTAPLSLLQQEGDLVVAADLVRVLEPLAQVCFRLGTVMLPDRLHHFLAIVQFHE